MFKHYMYTYALILYNINTPPSDIQPTTTTTTTFNAKLYYINESHKQNVDGPQNKKRFRAKSETLMMMMMMMKSVEKQEK